jgi:hypothetical protein
MQHKPRKTLPINSFITILILGTALGVRDIAVVMTECLLSRDSYSSGRSTEMTRKLKVSENLSRSIVGHIYNHSYIGGKDRGLQPKASHGPKHETLSEK